MYKSSIICRVCAAIAELWTKHWFCGSTLTKDGTKQICLNQKNL